MNKIKKRKELKLYYVEDLTRENYKESLPYIVKNMQRLINLDLVYISHIAAAANLDTRTLKKLAIGNIDNVQFNTANKLNVFIKELFEDKRMHDENQKKLEEDGSSGLA